MKVIPSQWTMYMWHVVEGHKTIATFWLKSDAEAFVHAMELDQLLRASYSF